MKCSALKVHMGGCHGFYSDGGLVGAAEIKIKKIYLEQSSSLLKKGMPLNLIGCDISKWLKLRIKVVRVV